MFSTFNTLWKNITGSAEAVVVSVENFLYEVNEDIWIDMSCLVLSDPLRNITLQSFSQPTNIPAPVVEKLKAGTPDNYPKQWSGFAVTIGDKLPRNNLSNRVSGYYVIV